MTDRKKHDEKSFERHRTQEVTTGFPSGKIVGRISAMCLRDVVVVARCLVDMGVPVGIGSGWTRLGLW
jgi:hypothetical protein